MISKHNHWEITIYSHTCIISISTNKTLSLIDNRKLAFSQIILLFRFLFR